MKTYFAQGDEESARFLQLANEMTKDIKAITPNILEEQKLLANCLAHLTYIDGYSSAVDVLLTNVLNRQLDDGFKVRVIKCLPKIYDDSHNQGLYDKIMSSLDQLKDFDKVLV